jgi:hypothetical protein
MENKNKSKTLKSKFIFLFLFSFFIFSFANVSALTSNLNSNLVYNFNLSEYYGAFDTTYTTDWAYEGVPRGAYNFSYSGIAGNGLFFDAGNSALDLNFSVFNLPTGIETQSIWIKLNAYNDGSILGGHRGGSYGERSSLNTTGGFNWDINPSANINSNISLDLNKWYNIVYIKGDNGQKIYVNGVLSAYSSSMATGNSSNQVPSSRYIGAGGQSTTAINGTLDEYQIWEGRELNLTDLQELYEYYIPPIYPKYTFNAPANNLNTTIKNPRFNISTSILDNSTINNVTLTILGPTNQTTILTNGTHTNNGTYTFITTLTDGSYNYSWFIEASNGYTNQTTSRNLSIYTIPPSPPGSLSSIFSLMLMAKDTDTPSGFKIMMVLTILFGIGMILIKKGH